MLDQEEIKNIPYFRNMLSIEEVKKGYPKRKKYKIITPKQNFFIKIHQHKLQLEEMTKEKKLYEIYRNLGISVVPLLDLIEYKNQTIFVYPFFEGISLKDMNLTLEEYYEYGRKVGQDIIQLQNFPVNSDFFKKLNLESYFYQDRKDIEELWRSATYQQKILQIFSVKEIKYLSVLYQSLFDFLKKQRVFLNHNDIKLANIMLDNQQNYYFIDIDPMGLTPSGFNIYYSIYSFLLPNFKEKEKTFLRGFIQTIDPHRKILKQLQYFLIADLINEAKMLLDDYFSELQENKEYMKKMIFNKEGLLEKMIYDGK